MLKNIPTYSNGMSQQANLSEMELHQPPTVHHNWCMARKRSTEGGEGMPPAAKADKRQGSRHKARKMVALEPAIYDLMQQLADRNNRPLRWQVQHVCVQALIDAGLWQPGQIKE